METRTENSVTVKNLEAALAGESMAYIKYMFFAGICREHGDEETAQAFEATAKQEVQHAFGHMELLFPKAGLDPAACLALAIAGETHEYTEMYPEFLHLAKQEQHAAAANEFSEQIEESKEHAAQFEAVLEKAAKRFAALVKVEERHANRYREVLERVTAQA